MYTKTDVALLAAALVGIGSSTATLAGSATEHFPVTTLMTSETTAAPVNNAAFLPGKDALAPAAWSGVLAIAQTRLQALPELERPLQDGRDARLFPAVSLEFFTDGDVLVPVQRGSMVRETLPGAVPSYWQVIQQFGRVWREPGDGQWSRAAVPLNLVNDTENHAHHGVATFLYRDGESVQRRCNAIRHARRTHESHGREISGASAGVAGRTTAGMAA